MIDFKSYRCKRAPHQGRSLAEVIQAKSVRDPATGCWIWQGCFAPAGKYAPRPIIAAGSKYHLVARVAWEIQSNPVPAGKAVARTCRNRACVNPAHLKLSTASAECLASWQDGERREKSRKLGGETLASVLRAFAARPRGMKGNVVLARELAAKHGVHVNTVKNAVRKNRRAA